MTEDFVLKVDGVGKKFCRSLKRSLWYGARDLVNELAGRDSRKSALRKGEFWAVRDISFFLGPGETLGLIGKNGAGKTTLLRMLNGLIKPDEGRIEVRGRMQALIALGAGFNPILTGRENVYVYGALLGIRKRKIELVYEDIVEFANLEEFMETPVQSYSSGMRVRLGFAVAAHLEPDILLVDEVLAVGDVDFKAKCHRKLGELKEKNVPWILVSHDMGTIRNQATRVIYLENGKVAFAGDPDEAIARYLYKVSEKAYQANKKQISETSKWPTRPIEGVSITGVRTLNGAGRSTDVFKTGEPCTIEVDFVSDRQFENPAFGIGIFAGDGVCYTGSNTRNDGCKIDAIHGRGTIGLRIASLPFLPGIYQIRLSVHDKHMGVIFRIDDIAYLRVEGGRLNRGLFFVPHTWHLSDKMENSEEMERHVNFAVDDDRT